MKKTQEVKQATQNPTEKESTNWVFIPLLKGHILKRTDGYVLFDVDGTASGIISAKFLRKKETDDMVFFSVPAEYEVSCRVRENVNGRWTTTKEYRAKAIDLRELVIKYNNSEQVPEDKLPF